MSTLRAALFDFGGVLTTSPFEAFARYEGEMGLPAGFLRGVNSTNHHDNAWARLERSEIDANEFSAAFAEESAALGHRVPGADVLALLGGDLRPRMVEAVRRCSERLAVGLLTNNFVAAEETVSGERGAHADVLSLFDEVVESRTLGVRKPDRRFYEIACERLEVAPSEAVFLDDLGVNLKPARAMGMRTIKVVDEEQALLNLEEVVGFSLG